MYLVGFAVGCLAAAYLFIRVSKDRIQPEPSEWIQVRLLPDGGGEEPPLEVGEAVFRHFFERLGEATEMEVVLVTNPDRELVRIQRGVGDGSPWERVRADALMVVSKRGIDAELMAAGFENIGLPVIEILKANTYLVRVKPLPVDSMALAWYELQRRDRYVEEVAYVELRQPVGDPEE